MAESADSLYYNFYVPHKRGQLSIDSLHVPRRLRKTVRQGPYTVTINKAFEEIIGSCAKERPERENTWINQTIQDVYIKLHKKGYAHSVECWDGHELAGGLYGVAIGRVFCGESMVSFRDDASKIGLVHLCARLWKGGFTVLDTQFSNQHLEQFGVYEINQKKYKDLIDAEMPRRGDFHLSKIEGGIPEEDLVREYLEYLSR